MRFHGLQHIGCALLVLGCTTSERGDGDAGSGTGGATAGTGASQGAGGEPPIENPTATTPEECHAPEGSGGGFLLLCSAVRIVLSESVPIDGVAAVIETNLGDTFSASQLCPHPDVPDCGAFAQGDPLLQGDGDPLKAIELVTPSPEYYAPASLHVTLTKDGQPIADAQLDDITYACHANTPYQWCWESDPIPLTVTLP